MAGRQYAAGLWTAKAAARRASAAGSGANVFNERSQRRHTMTNTAASKLPSEHHCAHVLERDKCVKCSDIVSSSSSKPAITLCRDCAKEEQLPYHHIQAPAVRLDSRSDVSAQSEVTISCCN